MEEIYHKKRNLYVCGTVGICATTRKEFVEEVFSISTYPVSATVDLIGVPATVMAKENKEIEKMYNDCSFAAIDGMPIVKLARKNGIECERCAAPDIMGLVFEESIKRGKTHYFYGGKNDDVLRLLKKNLEAKFPGIQIAGMYSPPFRTLTESEDEYVCREINDLSPDFVWVGIGAPKQEIWMQDHREKIPGTVMLGVGAGFDFYAGTLKKSPKWLESIGLEWLFRLTREPKRLWKRYILGGIKYIYYTIKTSKRIYRNHE
jgi:N-acetylglucosaminyldiphosphoundecaprenol N-acetyl-beta-D-mannosaminyltransferase